MFVHIIGGHENIGMPEQNFAQGFELIQRINPARRVAGAVDDEHPGSGRDGFFQLRRGYLEILLDAGLDDYRFAFRDKNDVGIGHPIGRGYDDFIARVDDGKHQIEKALLSAARNQNLARSIIKTIVTFEFGNDRILEAGGAAHCRIFCKTPVDGGNGGILDMLRGIKIRLAGAQPNDVLALCLEPRSPGSDRQSRGGLDGLNALREFHDNVLTLMPTVPAW